jgi:hypothetical protein
MTADAMPEPSPPRPAPARRMSQRELVILSLLARPDDSGPRKPG